MLDLAFASPRTVQAGVPRRLTQRVCVSLTCCSLRGFRRSCPFRVAAVPKQQPVRITARCRCTRSRRLPVTSTLYSLHHVTGHTRSSVKQDRHFQGDASGPAGLEISQIRGCCLLTSHTMELRTVPDAATLEIEPRTKTSRHALCATHAGETSGKGGACSREQGNHVELSEPSTTATPKSGVLFWQPQQLWVNATQSLVNLNALLKALKSSKPPRTKRANFV